MGGLYYFHFIGRKSEAEESEAVFPRVNTLEETEVFLDFQAMFFFLFLFFPLLMVTVCLSMGNKCDFSDSMTSMLSCDFLGLGELWQGLSCSLSPPWGGHQ